MLKKLGRLFFHSKKENNIQTTRILFFKFKKEIPAELMVLPTPNLRKCGRCTYYDTDLYIESPETTIGSFCSIGKHVTLGHGEHPLNFLSSSPYFYLDNLGWKRKSAVSHNEYWKMKPIAIGNDVWIGEGVFIKNGITVGDGAVLAAHAVITKDVPPYAVVAGVPAKIIRYRFSADIIEELLRLRWWELEDNMIKQIPYDDINAALAFLRRQRNII